MHYMLLHSYNLLLCVVLLIINYLDYLDYMYTICNVRSHVVEHFVHTAVMETH